MMNKELILCYTELKWTGMFFFVAVLIIRLRLIEHSTERAKGAECAECAECAKGAENWSFTYLYIWDERVLYFNIK